MNFFNIKNLFVFLCITIILAACGGQENNTNKNPNYVVVHLKAEPAQLNPVNARDMNSTIIFYGLFQELINADFKTMEKVPVLAKSLPTFSKIEGSDLIAMDFEIRDEAVWNDGTPITGEDVAFSLKVIKTPKVNCGPRKSLFTFIKDIEIDKNNPKKFRFITEVYMLAEDVMSDLRIIPSQYYDEKGILKNYTLAELSDESNAERLAADEQLSQFAEEFNSSKYQRDIIKGSGPYEMVDWQTEQRIILKKKDNWWGANIEGEQWYQANPDTIIYQIIAEDAPAMIALKNGDINTMFAIEPKLFTEECLTDDFKSKFYTFTPSLYAYDYIGFNLTNPKFEDVNTRKALAHLMDRDRLIEEAFYGLGQKTDCFSHPTRKDQIPSTLQPYDFNIEKAKEYLEKAGWADSNDDGILDKKINGVSTPLSIKLVTHVENDRRKAAARIFKEEAEQVGIEVTVETLVWNAFRKQISEDKDFDMYTAGWSASPFESDPKGVWHSSSINGGLNMVGYSSPVVDKAIDDMRQEIDKNKRLAYYHTIHEQINQDVPYIFLTTQKECIAVSRQFDNVWGTGMKPGFWASGFTVNETM